MPDASAAPAGWSATADYVLEGTAVVRGGLARGETLQGLATLTTTADWETIAGWPATTTFASVYWTHGASPSGKFVGDTGVLSNIDFTDSVRLFELWTEKAWRDDTWSLRLGQLALDAEFAGNDTAALFLNSNFGALGVLSLNTPAPIFAIAAPGVRLRQALPRNHYVQVALYDGNPAPDALGDPSPEFIAGTRLNRHGLRAKLAGSEGLLAIVELGRALSETTPTAWKVGLYYHTDTFADTRFDHDGLSLADPSSSGIARSHNHNHGAYAAVDQNLWSQGDRNVRAFARIGAAPGDRNAINRTWDLGITATGLIPFRPKDSLGLAAAGVLWSRAARDFDADTARFAGTTSQFAGSEHVIELTWLAPLGEHASLQPDVQYIRHPGGARDIADVVAVSLRLALSF